MAQVRVKLNSAGMHELLTSNGVRDALTARMQPVLALAISTAPVVTGAHRNSLHIEQDTTDRVAVRVVANSDHSIEAEADTGHMTRALEASGGEMGRVLHTSREGKTSRITAKQAKNYRNRRRTIR